MPMTYGPAQPSDGQRPGQAGPEVGEEGQALSLAWSSLHPPLSSSCDLHQLCLARLTAGATASFPCDCLFLTGSLQSQCRLAGDELGPDLGIWVWDSAQAAGAVSGPREAGVRRGRGRFISDYLWPSSRGSHGGLSGDIPSLHLNFRFYPVANSQCSVG